MQRVKVAPGRCQGRTPTTIRTTAECDGRDGGIMKLRRMRPQRSRAPGQQRAEAGQEQQERPIGIFTLVEERRADGDLIPCTHSESTGNSVPHSTVKQAASSIRLLNRKLDSRETSDSSLCSDFRWSRFCR